MADLGILVLATYQMPAAGNAFVVPGMWSMTRGSTTKSRQSPVSARDARLQGVTDVGSFAGSVQEAGVPVPNCVVRCYERKTGLMIREVRTDAAGNFVIQGVQRGSDQHYVIALDPDGGAIYNALIFDRVIPL